MARPLSLAMQDMQSGRDTMVVGEMTVVVNDSAPAETGTYLTARGPAAHRAFVGRPDGPWDTSIGAKESIADLRAKLFIAKERPPQPVEIKVTGTLFPCALLSSGWWDKQSQVVTRRISWRDEVQEWLFQGFDLWGPSWDFTWQFDNWDHTQHRPYFIAQLGDGDEANSLPVLIPSEKAKALHDYIRGCKKPWGGIDAQVKGVLGHRSRFKGELDEGALELFGGLLDYCLWLDEDNPKHYIEPLLDTTSVYSGYLWKCLTPKDCCPSGKPALNDVYFVWEHTNFASPSAVAYNLDSLARKEQYIAGLCASELKLVQKSSWIVPGTPDWEPDDIYRLLLKRAGPVTI